MRLKTSYWMQPHFFVPKWAPTSSFEPVSLLIYFLYTNLFLVDRGEPFELQQTLFISKNAELIFALKQSFSPSEHSQFTVICEEVWRLYFLRDPNSYKKLLGKNCPEKMGSEKNYGKIRGAPLVAIGLIGTEFLHTYIV